MCKSERPILMWYKNPEGFIQRCALSEQIHKSWKQIPGA